MGDYIGVKVLSIEGTLIANICLQNSLSLFLVQLLRSTTNRLCVNQANFVDSVSSICTLKFRESEYY